MLRLSLVIPCFNEEANLPLLLARCTRVIDTQGIEIVLVDNGSTDGTAQLLESLLPSYPGCRAVRVEANRGYGFGIIAGLHAAKGEILGWTHADMQADPQDALDGLHLFDKHGPNLFVKGLRFGRPLGDVAFTVGMSMFETVLLKKRMWDINAQPTMFHRQFFESWRSPPDDFSLDLYAYYLARTQGINIQRFPVRFGERAHGVSHWNVNWAAKRRFIRRTVSFSLQLRKNING